MGIEKDLQPLQSSDNDGDTISGLLCLIPHHNIINDNMLLYDICLPFLLLHSELVGNIT